MTRRLIRTLLCAVVLCAACGVGAAHAEFSPEALAAVRHLAIQHHGRHKPFDSFAREALAQITGSPRRGTEDPVETVLRLIASPERWQDVPLIVIPFVPLREALGLDAKTTRVSLNELLSTRKLMRLLPALVEKQRRNATFSMLDNETWDAYERFVLLNAIFEQRLELVPPPSGVGPSWLPILEPTGYPQDQQLAVREAWSALMAATRAERPEDIEASARRLGEILRGLNPSVSPAPWRLRLEVWCNRTAPFGVARVLYLISACALVLGMAWSRRWAGVGMAVLWAGFVAHGVGIALRVILGGRPPVSNFFETMLWLPFVAVLLSLILEGVYRARFIGLSAAILAALTLWLTEHVPLDPSLTPVVAVLRSNLWLTVHVLTIVASYGALSLATVLAHVYGWLYVTHRGQQPSAESLGILLYRVIQVGVVLLAGGIMLGAVWANASWGRYWGWDPKETWALITLLWFLAVLHGRFAGWIRGIGVALATIGGFFLLLMTYYGVSFYLVGLHSYAGGHAKPLPPLLVGYLIGEVLFLAVVGRAALSRRRAT